MLCGWSICYHLHHHLSSASSRGRHKKIIHTRKRQKVSVKTDECGEQLHNLPMATLSCNIKKKFVENEYFRFVLFDEKKRKERFTLKVMVVRRYIVLVTVYKFTYRPKSYVVFVRFFSV